VKKVKNILMQELPFFFMAPALLWQILFLYIPLAVLFLYSVIAYFPSLERYALTAEFYEEVFRLSSLRVLGSSFLLAIETTIICFLLAYPLAYFLVFKLRRFRIIGLLFVILPSWTSFIVQIYAWFFLLKKDGVVPQALSYIGVTSQPIHLLNNHFAMLVGMVYCYLPFMVLPLYAVLEKIDRRLIEASADLGATRWTTIQKIIFPLSLRGLGAGMFLVFIPAFGEFAIPEFLGGSRKLYWGNVIVSKFLEYRDWNSGAAAAYSSVLFPALFILFLYVTIKLGGYLRKMMEGFNHG
jgi:spermidine/putrescine transport system permease protein